MIADRDLLSIQQARILAENAEEAQKRLRTFSQKKLDEIVEHVATVVEKNVKDLAILSHNETYFGNWQDKLIKNQFVCSVLPKRLRAMRCVGVLSRNTNEGTVDIGVPVGVIAAFCPVTNPVSTTIYKTLLAIKSGNAIVFSPHPRAIKCISAALDIMITAAMEKGLPKGSISYMSTVEKKGSAELMRQKSVAILMITGVPGMLSLAEKSKKLFIYGGMGNGPAFIEKTANIQQAASDIIRSKAFDYGVAPSAEHSIVVESCIEPEVRRALEYYGAYFMTETESIQVAEMFYASNGICKIGSAGLSAGALARRAGLSVPENTAVLLAPRKYVAEADPYCKGMPAPVMAYYIEDDWMHACEKCIELLLYEKDAHTMTIHTTDEEVVMQFALKKPVGRLLVNTPSAFGGMGATTNLFPAMTLGSGSAGLGVTVDNVSPMNLVYIRKVGYGVRELGAQTICPTNRSAVATNQNSFGASPTDAAMLEKIIAEAIKALK